MVTEVDCSDVGPQYCQLPVHNHGIVWLVALTEPRAERIAAGRCRCSDRLGTSPVFAEGGATI